MAPTGLSINAQSLASLDARELRALMSVMDADSITDSKVRADLEARLNASLVCA